MSVADLLNKLILLLALQRNNTSLYIPCLSIHWNTMVYSLIRRNMHIHPVHRYLLDCFHIRNADLYGRDDIWFGLNMVNENSSPPPPIAVIFTRLISQKHLITLFLLIGRYQCTVPLHGFGLIVLKVIKGGKDKQNPPKLIDKSLSILA